MGSIVYISLGSNLDNPVQQIKTALSALRQIPDTNFIGCSSLYQTAPVGYWPQPDFINAVAALETSLSAETLLAQLQLVEHRQGRIRDGKKNRPRALDLDLLLYGNEIIQSPNLVVPHPRLHERAFVLMPLEEIAANLLIPPEMPLQQLLAALPSQQKQTVTCLLHDLLQ